MIIATAGRRVDPADPEQARFPLKNISLVKERVRAMLQKEAATAVVCSAACGADLIALAEAGALKLLRRVVLPFSPERFRETSVIDRPGDWGPLYDQILREVKEDNNLITLKETSEGEAYLAANIEILDQASELAKERGESVMATLIWNGESRGAEDITERFGNEARNRGWRVAEVRTLAT
jgi:hypothetical protein